MKKLLLILIILWPITDALALSGVLKVSTAVNVTVVMIDSTNHITGKTGLTLTIRASKAGGAFAAITPTVTELEGGVYKLAFTTSHTDTLGELRLRVTSSGADESDPIWQIVTLLPGDPVTLTSAYDPAKVDIWNVTLPSTYTGQKAGFLLWKIGNKP